MRLPECNLWILRQHPQLKEYAEKESKLITPENYKEILEKCKIKYGAELDVSPIPKDDHTHKDPLGELVEMVGKEKVIVIEEQGE